MGVSVEKECPDVVSLIMKTNTENERVFHALQVCYI